MNGRTGRFGRTTVATPTIAIAIAVTQDTETEEEEEVGGIRTDRRMIMNTRGTENGRLITTLVNGAVKTHTAPVTGRNALRIDTLEVGQRNPHHEVESLHLARDRALVHSRHRVHEVGPAQVRLEHTTTERSTDSRRLKLFALFHHWHRRLYGDVTMIVSRVRTKAIEDFKTGTTTLSLLRSSFARGTRGINTTARNLTIGPTGGLRWTRRTTANPTLWTTTIGVGTRVHLSTNLRLLPNLRPLFLL